MFVSFNHIPVSTEKDWSYCYTIKEIVVVVLIIFEDTDILEYLGFDLNPVIVTDRILTQEVEDDKVRRL